jgi:ABC-type siderophore export system fused ATPase/permease subunit
MKTTKRLFYVSIIATIPAMLSMLLLAIIGLEWWIAGSGSMAERLLTGNFNYQFVTILFSTGIPSMAIILASQLALSRYASKIDRLDEAEIQAWEAKRKYEEATRKLVQDIK